MTILNSLLRMLARLGANWTGAKSQPAKCSKTEQAIERYDQMLNASTRRRQGRAHAVGPRDLDG
jgi:hypothetical protein